MILNTYTTEDLHRSYGIDLGHIDVGPVETMGVGAAWGRVAPGGRSDPHQHDETETFVIVSGSGEVVVDAARHRVGPGVVVQFEPFETHHLDNTGDVDLLFATFYWRDAERAAHKAGGTGHRRFGQRPVFVFSSPTTPNGDLHLGHLCGPYLGADVFVRYQRMIGTEAWHIAGSDDFQSYVLATARDQGRTPAETAAHYSAEILATHRLMDINVDQYTVSSTDPGYVAGVRAFFSRIVSSGRVAPARRPALFDGTDGRYLYEVDVSGSCPTCGSRTGGNMCEECGEPNVCADLVDPRANGSDTAPVREDLVRYSLPLHELRAEITDHHHLGRVPARVKELADRLFARERLDVALTHPSEWGVTPVESGVDGQVVWVWVDMAYRFLYGIQAIGTRLGRDWRADVPQDDWKIVHFLGYDNTFYHAVLTPAQYALAHPDWSPDIDYHLNEFYLLEHDKFSTSRGHAVWGKDFLGPHNVDAVRFYLSWTRPETRRTSFRLEDYERFVEDELVGVWQRWLNGLGTRIEKNHAGLAPDAGVWTPEHTAFLARLQTRLAAMAVHLGQDGFSLNQAAEELHGIVTDTVRFTEREAATAGVGGWGDEARTVIALELAAAALLARCGAPVMPRFAGRLATALGIDEPNRWPHTVELVAAGTRIDLVRQVFFGAAPEPAPLRDWLSDAVRQTLRLPDATPVAEHTLVELGTESLQAIALQYQILQVTGADVPVEELLGCRTVAELADRLADAATSQVLTTGVEEMRL